jgi:hypothetical protein
VTDEIPLAPATPADPPAPVVVKKPSEDPMHFIIQEARFFDVSGRCVLQRIPVRGPRPEKFHEWHGEGDVKIAVPTPPNHPVREQTFPVRFPLVDAIDLPSAFDAFDAAFRKTAAEVEAQYAAHFERIRKEEEAKMAEHSKAQRAATGTPWQPPGGRIIKPR